MSNWIAFPLSRLAEVRVSNVDKIARLGETPVQLCNYMDVYTNDYIDSSIEFMQSTANLIEKEKFKVCSGDVIITKDSETPFDIGIPAVVMDDIRDLVCGYHLALIKPYRDKVEPVYLAKQLASNAAARYFSKMAAGSTRYGLSNGAIAATAIPIAPLEQQRKIAAILITIDQAIEKTEALIHKYQQIKAGLMHDLFTRGLTADGKLRPPREQAPELYQETPIGWIPKEWGFGLLNDIVNPFRPIVYGILMPGYGFDGGIPVVKVKDIQGGKIDTDNLLLTSPEIDNEYRRSRLKSGDILLTIRGSVGRVCIVPDELENANITQDTARIDLSEGNNKFYAYYFETDGATRHFSINTLGVAVQGINLGEVRKTPIPRPPVSEQTEIANRVSSICNSIDSEKENKEKLQLLKSGLMHDLLSGRVRVKVDDSNNQEAAA